MEEEVIDIVRAYTVEPQDRVRYMDPETGEWVIDTVVEVTDNGLTIDLRFEDREDPITFHCDQKFDLYGYVVETV